MTRCGFLAHGDVPQRNVRTGEIGEFPSRRAGLCYNGVVGCDRKAATTKLRQVGGGEIPSSAEVGKPFTRNTTTFDEPLILLGQIGFCTR